MKALTQGRKRIKKRSNIYDVARDSAVSVATVSRFLTGAAVISAAKQTRIRASIKKLDYRPHPIARSLALTDRSAIGLVVMRFSSRAYTDLVLADILFGISIAATAHSQSIHITFLERSQNLPQLLDRHRDIVDGSLILDATDFKNVREFLKTGHPAVIMNRWHPSLSCVHVNNRQGGVLAARHLIELGHRRIACLVSSAADGQERLRGYKAALDDAGLKPLAVVNCRQYSEVLAAKATRELLKSARPPTALLVVSDWMAIAAIREAHQLGWNIPRDLSIVGYDDAIVAEATSPPLTTIRQPLEELGKAAVETLLEIKKNQGQRFEKVLSPELVIRKSTAKPRE